MNTLLPVPESILDINADEEPESFLAQGPARRMSSETQDAIARMLVSGAPISTIAHATGRTPASLRSSLSTSAMQERIEAARAVILRQTAIHYFEMMEFLPDARAAIASGLAGGDLRMKVDIAKWLHENLTPSLVKRAEVDIHHSGQMNGGGVDLGPVMGALSDSIKELAAARRTGGSGLDRVKTGPDAAQRIAPSFEGDGER